MGKKYIVEVGRLERLYKAYVNGNGKPNITWLAPEVDLTPYTEPDLEQVRKEGYKQGIADAWGAARKIIHMPEGDLLNVFTECYSAVCTALQVILKYDASEAIEKIRQYEQGQEIKVGDEVVSEDDIKAVVIDMDDYLLHVLDENGLVQGWPREDVVKTDRHFPDIATVLKKMKEVQK